MGSIIKKIALVSCIMAGLTSPALADLTVAFDEGAPKDRFTFSNNGDCNIEAAKLTLDLSGSKSGLIFDVTSKGAGVEVFQPLELVSGQDSLNLVPSVKDGDAIIRFDIKNLRAGENISFTIDVDDTMGGREITVSGSEIAGAKVSLQSNGETVTSSFDETAKTALKLSGCNAA